MIDLKGLFKNAVSGGLSKLADSTKGIIEAVSEGKLNKVEALAQIEAEKNRHEEAIINHALELDKAYLADVADAREANKSIQESEKASWMAKNIAYVIDIWMAFIWGVFTIYLAAIAAKILETKADMTGLLSIYSTITAVFMITVNFHRGTSQGSTDKQKLLDKMLKR